MFSISNRIRRQRYLKAQESIVIHVEPPPIPRYETKSRRRPLSKPKIVPLPLSISSSINKPSGSQRQADALVQAKNRLELALSHSHAPKTSKNYDYAVRRYIQFAASIGFSENDALPASEELILLWICEGLGKTGPGTAKQNLSALRAWHLKQRLPWHRPECIPFISKALKEFWPHESKKPASRPPITSSMMMMLVKAWQDGSPKDLCALAIALVAWCGQCRLGELLPESQRSFDAKRLPRRSHWSGLIHSKPNDSELHLHGQRQGFLTATKSSLFANVNLSTPLTHSHVTLPPRL